MIKHQIVVSDKETGETICTIDMDDDHLYHLKTRLSESTVQFIPLNFYEIAKGD